MPKGKPNILVIWGDDIGIANLSCYTDGLMGYRTPNIDRIAKEGMRFTDSYGEHPVPPAAPASSPDRAASAPASRKWACPAPSSASRLRIRPSPSS
jgi:Sulfatase